MTARMLAAAAVVMVALAASKATWAQTPPAGGKRRSPQEEKRRKLLEEVGLDKQAPPAPAPPPTPAPQDAARGQSTPPVPGPAPGPLPGKTSSAAPAPSFRRAIHPALMAACGACHRAGGPAAATRMTMSGDAALDHAAVARLVTVADPAASPLLVKVSGAPHGGGAPWPPDSSTYRRTLSWIARGARLDAASAEPVVAAPPAPSPVARKPDVEPPVARRPPAPPPAAAGAPEVPPAPAPVVPTTAAPVASPPSSPFAGAHQVLMSACASCHRAGAPAAMTRLVLSGDPAADETAARPLLEPVAPEQSPLLTKAVGAMHGGGAVLSPGDPRYAALLAWATPAPTVNAAAPPAAPAAAAGVVALPAPAPPPAPPPSPVRRPPHAGLELPLGFLLNGRFDLNYERREFTGHAFGSEGVNALRSYHHFLFLSRTRADEPCGLSLEILALTFWEAHCRVLERARALNVVVAGGKLVVPFGADPLLHQSYGGLAGFDQRLLPAIWAQEGIAGHLVYGRGEVVVTDDLFVVRGYGLDRADGVLDLQNDFSPTDRVRLAWGNRLGAAWRGISAWYSAYFNPLGFDRRLFMQAFDVTVYRQRAIPVLGHFSFGAGLLHADVSGGESAGVGGPGKDYYHFGSYLQVRYHPTDWLFVQYRQGLHTFDNRRALVLDNARLTSADGSAHNFGVVGRYHGLSLGVYYFLNLEKVDEVPDDLFRVSVAYEF